jgi:hypothetical protein
MRRRRAAGRIAFPEGDADDAALLVYETVLCAVAVGLAVALVRERWRRPPVADLVVELGETRTATVRNALAYALGDPSLEVAYAAGGAWVGTAAPSGSPRDRAPGSDGTA